jgi:hypothetical protein
MIVRGQRMLNTSLQSQRCLHLIVEEYRLAEVMLKANVNNLEAMKNLVEAATTIGDRLSAYNEGLNHLTSAVRTKVSRVDKEGVKL